MSRTLVVGGTHGAARALHQALDRAGFDSAADRLICLGDICDRGRRWTSP
jgi:serine/threonine protein phosphatase 1